MIAKCDIIEVAEMGVVEEFRARRKRRLDARFGVEIDSVDEYKRRRGKRRYDASLKRLYGVAIGMKIPNASELEPPELIKALEGKG